MAEQAVNDGMVARVTLAVILTGLAANLGYNLLQAAAGAEFPYTSFLFDPADRFADFFKLLMALPGPELRPSAVFPFLTERMPDFADQIDRFQRANGIYNPMHQPPLPMALAMAMRWLVERVDFGLVFVLAVLAYAGAATTTMARQAPSHRAWWAAAILLSYPFLMTLDRGHMFSAITGLCLIGGTMRSVRGRVDALTILMFAVALNFRPNAAILPGALWLVGMHWKFRHAVWLGIATLAIGAVTYAYAHAVFPGYDWAAIQSGLGDYYKLYVLGKAGIPYSSSLLGAVALTLGLDRFTLQIPLVIGATMAALTILARWRGRIATAPFLFMIVAIYIFASQVTADYHVIVAFIPLLALAHEGREQDLTYRAILFACLAVLIPKNYLFDASMPPISSQVVFNSLILTAGAAVVLWEAWRPRRAGAAPVRDDDDCKAAVAG